MPKRGSAILTFGALLVVFAGGCVFFASKYLPPKVIESFTTSSLPISYHEFLKMRDDPETIILDAGQMEPLFWVVPESVARQGKGLTQAELDSALSDVIPSKESKIILHCYQNFAPTRMMPARSSVASHLRANGYKRVYELADLWHDQGFDETDSAFKIAEKEIFPYTRKLPNSVATLLQGIQPGLPQ